MKRILIKYRTPHMGVNSNSVSHGEELQEETFDEVVDICYEADWLTLRMNNGGIVSFPVSRINSVYEYP